MPFFADSCQAEKTYLRRVMRELSKCQTDAGVAGPDALVSVIFYSYIIFEQGGAVHDSSVCATGCVHEQEYTHVGTLSIHCK